LPLPVAPDATVIHDALLEAVQLQPVPTVTGTEPVKAAEPTFAEFDEIAAAHGVPDCVSVKVLPPMVSVPVLDVLSGLAVPL
jgi:hypothetical protein